MFLLLYLISIEFTDLNYCARKARGANVQSFALW